MAGAKTFDGYVRVSAVKGRGGPSYISPDVQADTIRRLAAAKGVEVGEIVVEENVSGGRAVEERELGRLVERVESGESGGIIVWKLSRFSRSLLGAVDATARIVAAGGRLIADDFDSAQPMGKVLLGLLAGLAEEELDARRAGWAEARSRSVDRGAAPSRAPLGYRKGKDGAFVVVEAQARKVRDAFQRRASGEPFSSIGRRYGWSHSTIRQMLANRAYLGVVQHGAFVNEDAHPPIVDRALFDAANAQRTVAPIPPGDTTRDRLLIGLARCAGCGHTLKTVRRPRADGTYAVAYFCKNAAAVQCEERAFVQADLLDAYVQTFFEAALQRTPRLVDVLAADSELEAAQAEQIAAEAELDAYVDAASALDAARFQRGIAKRQERVEEAHQLVGSLSARTARLPAGGPLASMWATLDPLQQRDVLAGFLDRVTVSRGAGKPKRGRSVGDYVEMVWSDGTVAENEQTAGMRAA
jgi:DNA invertase Pin-like site-specific DNA recombinase